MIRLLIWRALGPPKGWLMPSVYFAGPTRAYGRPALPQVGLAVLLPLPSRASTSNGTDADADGAIAMIPPVTRAATAVTGSTLVSQVFRLALKFTDPPQDLPDVAPQDGRLPQRRRGGARRTTRRVRWKDLAGRWTQ